MVLITLQWYQLTAWLLQRCAPLMPGGRVQGNLWWCFYVEETLLHWSILEFTPVFQGDRQGLLITFFLISTASVQQYSPSSLALFKKCRFYKLFSIYMVPLCSLKFLLLEGDICLVKKYKPGPVFHFCNLRLYSEHPAFGVLNAKGDCPNPHCGTCWWESSVTIIILWDATLKNFSNSIKEEDRK